MESSNEIKDKLLKLATSCINNRDFYKSDKYSIETYNYNHGYYSRNSWDEEKSLFERRVVRIDEENEFRNLKESHTWQYRFDIKSRDKMEKFIYEKTPRTEPLYSMIDIKFENLPMLSLNLYSEEREWKTLEKVNSYLENKKGFFKFLFKKKKEFIECHLQEASIKYFFTIRQGSLEANISFEEGIALVKLITENKKKFEIEADSELLNERLKQFSK